MYNVKKAADSMSPRAQRKVGSHVKVGGDSQRLPLDGSMSGTTAIQTIPLEQLKKSDGIDNRTYDLREKAFKRLVLPFTPLEGLSIPDWIPRAPHNLDVEKQQWFTEPIPFAVPVYHTWTAKDIEDILDSLMGVASDTVGNEIDLHDATTGTTLRLCNSTALGRRPFEFLLIILEPMPEQTGMMKGNVRKFKSLKDMLYTLRVEAEVELREMSVCLKMFLPQVFVLGVVIGGRRALTYFSSLEHYLCIGDDVPCLDYLKAIETNLAIDGDINTPSALPDLINGYMNENNTLN